MHWDVPAGPDRDGVLRVQFGRERCGTDDELIGMLRIEAVRAEALGFQATADAIRKIISSLLAEHETSGG